MRTPNSICAFCGLEFYKRPSQKMQTKKDFCSIKCYSLWKISNNQRECPVCRRHFHPKRREQKFCSVKCSASRPRSERANGKGKNKSQTLLDLIQATECLVCGYDKVLHVHRIKAGKDGGKYEPENIVALCPNCHAEFHQGLLELEPYLEQ